MAQYRRLPGVSEETTLFGPPSFPPEEASSGTTLSESSFSGRDIWKQFEVHRRTAEYYLKQYLEQLDRISDASIVESDGLDDFTQALDAVARDGQSENRDLIRLQISSDTAIRDITAMQTIVQFVLALPPREARVVTTVAGVSTAVCTVSAFVASPVTAASAAWMGGAVFSAMAMAAIPVRNMFQKKGLQDIEVWLHTLKETFQQSGIKEKNRNDLKREHFAALEQATKRYKS